MSYDQRVLGTESKKGTFPNMKNKAFSNLWNSESQGHAAAVMDVIWRWRKDIRAVPEQALSHCPSQKAAKLRALTEPILPLRKGC